MHDMKRVYTLLFLLFGLLMTWAAARQLEAWQRLRQTAVEVTATVSQVTELGSSPARFDSRSRRYRLYLTYELDGVTYRDVYYGVKTASPDRAPAVGQQRQVRINPEKPQEISPEGFYLLFLVPIALVSCMAAMALLMWAAGCCWQQDGPERISADRSAIQAALDARSARMRRRVWLSAGMLLLFSAVAALVLHGRPYAGMMLAMLALCTVVALAVTLVLLTRSTRAWRVASLVQATLQVTPEDALAETEGREYWLLPDGRQLPVDDTVPGVQLVSLQPGMSCQLAVSRKNAVLWILPGDAATNSEAAVDISCTL